jgi:hypothetical protein
MILAQLREIYDGSFAKEWGNGKSFRWAGKVGLLAGVTGAIDRAYSMNTILGERFLLFRPKSPPAYDLARGVRSRRPRRRSASGASGCVRSRRRSCSAVPRHRRPWASR